MNRIIWLVGLVVIVLFIAGYLGLRWAYKDAAFTLRAPMESTWDSVSGESLLYLQSYALMKFGGFPGIDTDHHPIPWNILS